MAKRKTILGLLASFFLCLCAICFAACGESKTISYITVGITGINNDNQTSLSVERNYGNTSDLGNFVIIATYSDASTKALSENELTVDVTVDNNSSTFSDYKTAIQNGGLNVGSYVLVFSYEGFSFTVNIDVVPADDVSVYSLNLSSATTKMGSKTITEKNTMFFGTAAEKISYEVLNDNQLQQNIACEGVYILNTRLENLSCEPMDVTNGAPADLKTPIAYENEGLLGLMSNDESLDNWAMLEPGKYLICAKIKLDDNHNSTYTGFQTITVEKAPFVVENDTIDETNPEAYQGLKFSWEYIQSRGYYYNVSFSEMLESRNTYMNEGFSGRAFALTLCEDGETKTYKQKIALTDIVDSSEREVENSIAKILEYGTFVTLPDENQAEAKFNASASYQKVKVKFVPNDNYSDLYEESEPFEILLKVNPGKFTIQAAEFNGGYFDYDSNGQPKTNTFKVGLLNAPYDITYSSNLNYTFDAENVQHVFNTTAAGNYSATFAFKGSYNNFFWQYPADFAPNGYNVTTTTVNYDGQDLITSITYNWTISKLNLESSNLGFGLFDVNATDSSINFVAEDGSLVVYLKAVFENNSAIDLTNQGIQLNWSVKPLGTTADSLTSTVEGSLENCANKDNNIFKKFVYTSATTNADNYLYLAIEITFAGNANIEQFSKVFMLGINKIQPSKEVSNQMMNKFVNEEDNSTIYYIIYNEGDCYASILDSLPLTPYGSWEIYSTVDCINVTAEDSIAKGAYELIFTANENMPFVMSNTITFYMLTSVPTSMADFY